MRGWLIANLFLLGMILVACGLWYLGIKTIRALELSTTVEQLLVALVSVGCVVAAALLGRQVLRAFGNRRA